MPSPFRSLRSFFFWIHLCVGVSAGAIILLMSVTGVLLGFERQMIAAIDGTTTVQTAPGLDRLPLDALLARHGIEQSSVASILVRAEDDRPVTVRFRDRERAALLIDPWRGVAVVAPPSGKGQAFFSALRRWHRWVGATGGEWRARFRSVTGAANLGFLFLVLSGMYLWWPRRWTRQRVAATTIPQLNAKGKARDFNWHHSFGILSAIPLALVVATGVFISYQWPGRLLDRVLGSESERAAAIAAGRAQSGGASPASGGATKASASEQPVLPAFALAPIVRAVVGARPEWRQLTFTLPAPGERELRVAVAEGNTYRPDLRYTLVFDAPSGALVSTSAYADLSASRRIRAWVRFGHTGEVFGVAGQLIATLVTAAGAILVWTGIALSWRRWRQWRKRNRVVAASAR